MKTIYIYIASVLTLMLSSCNLDKYPYSEIASDDYVKDAQSVNTLVVGAYNSLHGVMYYEWALTELLSDNSRMYATGSSSNTSKLIEQLDQHVLNSDHEWVDSYWTSSYVTISRCNNVLAALDVVSDETTRKQYEGEARFLRAMQYFNLVRLFGPVFIVTQKTSSDVARNQQRATIDEVYQLIETDLQTIISSNLLPEQMPKNDTGRATMIAAKALLSKVYATHYEAGSEQYGNAITLARDVITSSAVGEPKSSANLVPYAKIFDISNEMSKEIIFAVRYTGGNQGIGSPFGNMFAPINNGANVIIGTSSSYNTPSDNLIVAYNNRGTEQKPDLRKDVNIQERYWNATTGQWVETGNCRYCPKYTYPVTTQYDGESDWPVIRFADIALLYAEMLNETQGPNEESKKYLNMISERAGLPAYTKEQLTSKYDLRQAIRLERRLELAFENQRWFDLLRWGIATETVNNFLANESMYAQYSYKVNPISDWQNRLPIPISIININSSVAQNVGY